VGENFEDLASSLGRLGDKE